jgi:hypothetical protein
MKTFSEMATSLCSILILLLLPRHLSAGDQTRWGDAPEKWSAPIKIALVSGSYDVHRTCCVTGDGQTMYLCIGSSVAVSHKQGEQWSTPTLLGEPINVPGELTENPSVTADGRTLIFRRFGGSYWILFQSHWNDSLNNWGEVTDLGPNISNGGGNFGMIPDTGRHLVFFRGLPLLSRWNDTTKSWDLPQWVDYWKTLGVAGGLWMSRDLRKLYYDSFDGTEYDLYVHYCDTISGTWSDPMRLNLHSMLDTSVSQDYHYQGFPWLSVDGRTLYFVSTHERDLGVYMSRMVVDENGDTVTTGVTSAPSTAHGDELMQNWPNPFNASTWITFRLAKPGPVCIRLYDVLGREVLVHQYPFLHPGEHRVFLHQEGLATGVYLCLLVTESSNLCRKILAVK